MTQQLLSKGAEYRPGVTAKSSSTSSQFEVLSCEKISMHCSTNHSRSSSRMCLSSHLPPSFSEYDTFHNPHSESLTIFPSTFDTLYLDIPFFFYVLLVFEPLRHFERRDIAHRTFWIYCDFLNAIIIYIFQ
jgi:hypothetical protein